MILLVHSCTGREAFLNIWQKCFDKSGWDIDVKYITGDEAFSDQLIRVLSEMDDEYLFYTLDDYWIAFTIDFRFYWKSALTLRADALRIQPNVTYHSLPYRFSTGGDFLKQTEESEYRISMATSIWRREYFLENLTPGLDPWQLENTKPNLGDVYFVPGLPFWYINGTIKGILTEQGREVIND